MAWRAVPIVCELCGQRIRVVNERYRRRRLGDWPGFHEYNDRIRLERHTDIRKCLPKLVADLESRLASLKRVMRG